MKLNSHQKSKEDLKQENDLFDLFTSKHIPSENSETKNSKLEVIKEDLENNSNENNFKKISTTTNCDVLNDLFG